MGLREALYVIAYQSVSVFVAAIIVLLLGRATKWRFPGIAILLGSIGVPAAIMAFSVYVAVFSAGDVHSREGVATGLTALVLVSFLTLPFTVVTSLVVVRMAKS